MKKHLLLVLALLGGAVSAQPDGWRPFAELQAGLLTSRHATTPVFGATLGLRNSHLGVGLRYRSSLSPLHEAEPVRDLSLMVQYSQPLAPRLELYGGVATGFALEHMRLASGKATPLQLCTELNLGLRYYVSDNIAITFSLGYGVRPGGSDWASLAKQLPYDPRTIPTHATATGGVSIGIPPKTKKINLPQQLIVDGAAPILTAYTD